MKRLIAGALICVFVVSVGCINALEPPTLAAIEAKAKDSKQRSQLFTATLPKIKVQLKDGPEKADTIKYLDNLQKDFAKDAQADQNIWEAIRDQHSLPKPAP